MEILLEDGPCLVVLKPGGVLTQAPPGIDSMELRVRKYLKPRAKNPDFIYVGVPHRLDRPASGVMVFGTTRRATRRISEQFEGHLVDKTYWALVEGDVQPSDGTWTDHVRKVDGQAKSEVVGEHAGGRIAILHYRVLQRRESSSFLQIKLQTGRTHQVRVQAATRGHAVFGDHLYGSQTAFGPQVEDMRQRWIALHARILTLQHPKTRRPITVTAPLPKSWQAVGYEFQNPDTDVGAVDDSNQKNKPGRLE